jgi:hypothetical protein
MTAAALTVLEYSDRNVGIACRLNNRFSIIFYLFFFGSAVLLFGLQRTTSGTVSG